MPAIPEPSGQVAIYVSGSDCSPERLLSSDELGWLYVSCGSLCKAIHSDPYA
jgi:hypothetical protein